MKYTKSKLRYACYRAKNGCVLDKHKEAIDYVERFLTPEHKWDRFSITWDILLDEKTGNIEIIKPEDDFNFINNTCLEAKILAKKKLPFDDFNNRQQNILKIIESHMLGGLMSWQNYGETWEVNLDGATKQITTKMMNTKSNQIEVTEEMINASKRTPENTPAPENTAREATPEEIKIIREQMRKMGVETPEPNNKTSEPKKKTKKKKSKKKKTTKKVTKKTSDN